MQNLVRTKEDFISNIRAYNQHLQNADQYASEISHSLFRTTTMSRRWYAIEMHGEWLLGPAKYCGYENQNPVTYEHYRKDMSGTDAYKVAQQFAAQNSVEEHHPAYKKLQSMALHYNNGTPSSVAEVYIIHADEPLLAPRDEMFVNSFLMLIRDSSMSDDARLELAHRLKG